MPKTARRRLALSIALLATVATLTTPPLAGAKTAEPPLYTKARQLTFEGRRAGEGYFSADGSRMVFQSERGGENPFYGMHLLDLETGDVRRISPERAKTAGGWLHPTRNVAMFSSTQLDPEIDTKIQAELDFRASGQIRRNSSDFDPAFEIMTVDLQTGVYTRLTNAEGYDAGGAYSPDGRQIAFASNRAAYAADLAGADATRLQNDPSSYMDIYLMDADGSNLRRLTDAPGYDGGVFWSADGESLVWRRFSEDGTTAEIFVMDADGANPRRITDLGAIAGDPFFHPSGAYVIFAANREGFGNVELYLVDIDGARAPVRVTDREGFDGLPTFSPDGATLSWTSDRTSDDNAQIFVAEWDHEAALRRLGLVETTGGPGAPQLGAALASTEAAISAADLETHVRAMASEAMEGRLTGAAGGKAATAYVAALFERAGLEPAGVDGGYFEPFTFTSGVSLGRDNSLVAQLPPRAPATDTEGALFEDDAQSVDFAIDQDWRPLGLSKSGATEPLEVVFAGYGLVAGATRDLPAYDALAGEDDALQGRWALVWRGAPPESSRERRAQLMRVAGIGYKASVARARGAAGLIVADGPGAGYAEGLPELSVSSQTKGDAIPVIAVTRATAERLLRAGGLDPATVADGLADGSGAGAMRPLAGVTLSARIDLDFKTRTGRNVLGRLSMGGDPNAAPAVIGAHVDHLGRGGTYASRAKPDEAGGVHYGADDNASGTAALMEIAETLAAERRAGVVSGARDVVFAAWSGEELGLIGSSRHVERLKRLADAPDLKGVIASYINMDMVGRLREDRLRLSGLGSSSVWRREIERRNAVIGLAISTSDDAYLPTDSTPFYLAGVPVLSATTGTHDDYHTPRDTADLINYEGLEQVARLMRLFVIGQAQAATPPDYIELQRTNAGPTRTGALYLGTIPDYVQEGVRGVALSGVVKGGPAAEAGLKGGDRLVGLAGEELVNLYDLMRVMNGLKADETVSAEVVRGAQTLTLKITPRRRQ